MRSSILSGVLATVLFGLGACGGARTPHATTGGALQLSKVVLYRNGVGYFERGGKVDGDELTIRVRKDQVNDLLKSLTVVERAGGRAVSISMPLDPRSWANGAIATLGPGSGSLFEVLDKLRGTEVTLTLSNGNSMRGRILIVEALRPDGRPRAAGDTGTEDEQDYKVTLIRDQKLSVVRLSKVAGITLHNGNIALQFQRSLDATAGEGMFQQVDVTIRLAGKKVNDLVVSYVVSAPMWKPTYRVVLPETGKGQALLQGWAVVDNTTGEDWTDVKLALTSGAPIAFRYDLHTPRDVLRTDLSAIGTQRRAQVSVGESGYNQPAPSPPPPAVEAEAPMEEMSRDAKQGAKKRPAPAKAPPANRPSKISGAGSSAAKKDMESDADMPAGDYWNNMPVGGAVDADALSRSMEARTRAASISGLTRYDLDENLTVPDGTSTMVAIINAKVEGEETFLFRPGGAGQGYEANPYRVIRFKNSTPFALESGPISIYSGGSFVGEGISEPVSAGVAVTIPFAVESSLLVASNLQYGGDEMRLVKIVRGVMEIENFSRRQTTWEITAQQPRTAETTLYVRHPKAGGSFTLVPRPAATEDLPDAYLIPIRLAAGANTAKLEVIEQTPSRSTLSIWDSRSLILLEGILAQGTLDRTIRARLEPIVKLRQEVGKIDTEIEGKTRTRGELDQRAQETRSNLEAIKRDPAAGALRKRLGERLDQFAKDGDKLGRELVELQTKRTEKKIALEDIMQNLELTPKEPLAPKK
ncbi:MAG: DUF4139 domain-containing protein [Deltaproteobacteria bacterium]|nr:DUF4139 domain-containing protein [Deltaproteobacteria bacterium]